MKNEVKDTEKSNERFECDLKKALDIIGKSENLIIINKLSEKPARYSEIKEYVDSVSEATLAKRLKWLSSEGLIIRKQEETIPPKVTYELTFKAAPLIQVIKSLKEFGRSCK